MKQSKSPLAQAESKLGALSLDELIELQATLADLVAVKRAKSGLLVDILLNDVDASAGAASKPAKRQAAGHIESKMINGSGPYLYLRKWSGKTLTSKYIGKGQADSAGQESTEQTTAQPELAE